MMTIHRVIVGRALLLVFCLIVQACSPNSGQMPVRSSKFLMGTLVTVTVSGQRDQALKAIDAVFDEIRRIEDLTSFHSASELSRINDMAGKQPVKVSHELVTLISNGLSFARETRGAFDPTIGAVTRLWGFSGSEESRIPQKTKIESALQKVGWQKVLVDNQDNSVFLPESGMALDLGGIAKCYALDCVRAVLTKNGVLSALVDIGGDILALGEKEPGTAWNIGVQNPREPKRLYAVVKIKDRAVVTSGDYERCFFQDGKRYHHILDPSTGYPAEGMQSVTIVAPNAMTIPSTGVFVMGVSAGIEFLDAIKGVNGLIVDMKGNPHFSNDSKYVFQLN
jgi:FAD:protein FMN transferase